eukprot:2823039-Rhodomonas_salina.2
MTVPEMGWESGARRAAETRARRALEAAQRRRSSTISAAARCSCDSHPSCPDNHTRTRTHAHVRS